MRRDERLLTGYFSFSLHQAYMMSVLTVWGRSLIHEEMRLDLRRRFKVLEIQNPFEPEKMPAVLQTGFEKAFLKACAEEAKMAKSPENRMIPVQTKPWAASGWLGGLSLANRLFL